MKIRNKATLRRPGKPSRDACRRRVLHYLQWRSCIHHRLYELDYGVAWRMIAIGVALHFSASGQSPENPAEIIELSEYLVEGRGARESISPFARELDAVDGISRSVLEAPRGVSVINEVILLDRGIDTVEETLFYVPGAYAPSRFGNVTAPSVRGDTAETYTNGQRRSGNIFGYKPSFNAVEGVDVVRGPGSAVFGPGQQSGGYVNYVSKKARHEDDWSHFNIRFGSWLPGSESFANLRWQVDVNRALSDKLALRLSYEGQENATLFHGRGARDDHQDIYLNVHWKMRSGNTLEVAAQYIWQASPQLLGVNRPSQALIDRGHYLKGGPDGSQLFDPGLLEGGSGDFTSLSPTDTVFSDDDFSNANVGFLQSVFSAGDPEGFQFVNRTLFDHVNRRRFHEFQYIEYVTQWTFENRTELHGRVRIMDLENEFVAGATIRFEKRRSFVNYFSEFPYAFDISSGSSNLSAQDLFGAFVVPGIPGPGGRGFLTPASGLLATPETVSSRFWNPALFLQNRVTLSDSLAFQWGLRGDAYFVRAEDPLPAGGLPPLQDNDIFVSGGFNVSAILRPGENQSFYATYNFTHAVNGNTVGGGINLYGDGGIDKNDFRNRSKLVEGGVRFRLRDGRGFVGLTGYRQERQRTELRSGKSDILVWGGELESLFQVSDRSYFFGNLSFSDAHFRHSAPVEFGGRSLGNYYAEGRGPAGLGNGIGYINGFFINSAPPGNSRIPGVSRWIASGGFKMVSQSGLGLSLWGTFRTEQNGNVDGEFVIPSQFSLNGTVSWSRGDFEAAVDVLNLSDEANWLHNGDTFFDNLLISRELPRRIEARVRWRF